MDFGIPRMRPRTFYPEDPACAWCGATSIAGSFLVTRPGSPFICQPCITAGKDATPAPVRAPVSRETSPPVAPRSPPPPGPLPPDRGDPLAGLDKLGR